MNISQKQTILSEIEAIEELNINEIVLQRFPEGTHIESQMIANYNIPEFIRLLKKTISQLKAEIENGFGLLLPNQENFHNDYGQITLDKDIGTFRLALINNSDQQGILLDRLIYYQIRQGFWDRSKVKIHNVNEEKIHMLIDRMNLIQDNLEKSNNVFLTLSEDYNSGITATNTFLDEKKKELVSISEMLNTAKASMDRINEHLVSASTNDSSIAGLLKNISEKIESVNNDIIDYQSEFSTLLSEINTCNAELGNSLTAASTNLKESKEKLEFIESKKEEIVRLTGMAADGALGSKFNDRQSQLSKTLTYWRLAVPGVTVLACIWGIVVFTCLHTELGNDWIELAVNLAKTSPAFILLGFVFKQYSKERNIQEEYAFKSSVAMTLTAYSSMLENKDEELNKSRQDMLLKSIEQIYTQPKIHAESISRKELIDFNNLKDAVQILGDSVKGLKP